MNRFKIWERSYIKFVVKFSLFIVGIFFSISQVKAATFYVSPNGSNSKSGTSTSSPWKTFEFAIPKLNPGDTLFLKDGTYTKSTTGLPKIFCGKHAKNGSATNPITIKAENERKAFLKSDGTVAAFEMNGCSYWNIIGLRGASADLSRSKGGKQFSVFKFKSTKNLTLKRLLGSNNNRYFNTHIFAIEYSYNIQIEESEAYNFHRHGFMAFTSNYVTFRRVYCNSRGWDGISGGYNPTAKGQDCVTQYFSSDGIIENSMSDDTVISIIGGDNNLVLGNYVRNLGSQAFALQVETRSNNNKYAENNVFENNVVIDAVKPQGFAHRGAINTLVTNLTAIKSGKNIQVRQKDSDNKPISNTSFTGVNTLSIYGSTGFLIEGTIGGGLKIDYPNAYGNRYTDYSPSDSYFNNSSITNPQMYNPSTGKGCIAYVPASSPMKGGGKDGADIGANIIYRYENGILTSTKLWNQNTGQFPCGAVVKGVNDDATFPGSSCINVHKRLNVGVNGCAIP